MSNFISCFVWSEASSLQAGFHQKLLKKQIDYIKVMPMLDYQRISDVAQDRSRKAALCIVTQTQGSSPRKASARMLVFDNGTMEGFVEGSIGGGAIEHRVRTEAVEAILERAPRQIRVSLTNELGMCCGGQMTVYIEPLVSKPPLIILGAGHIGEALCRLGAQCGFDAMVADPRVDLLNSERLPFAAALFHDYSTYELDKMPFGDDAYVLVTTHDHQVDQTLVEEILPRRYAYLGLVASQRKAALTKKRCLSKGFSEELLNSLISPAGLDISSQTPEEIALSILAQMVQKRRNDSSTQVRSTHRSGGDKFSHGGTQSESVIGGAHLS
jgi:xanthine dehydrogenase accessory factor